MKSMRLNLRMPRFLPYTKQHGGHLDDKPEVHALWFYYLMARSAYEQVECGFEIQYDLQQQSTQTHYRQQFESAALAYSVNPNEMAKYWDQVDRQCTAMNLPRMPEGERFRFNTTSEGFTGRRDH